MTKQFLVSNFQKIIALAIFILLAGALLLYFYHPEQKLKVSFLDVGQGSSILIQTPYDQNILIDGGDTEAKILRQLPKFMPFYDRTFDLVILTHPHDDHAGGLVKVFKRYKVRQIVYTGAAHTSPAYLEFLGIIKASQIPLAIIERGQNIILGDKLNLEILYPLSSFLNREVDNLNNTSIITKLSYGAHKFLFPGDAEIEVEEEILKSKVDIEADVIAAGHHGSDTSSSQAFLDKIKPQYAVIQVGKGNDFGHPSLRVLRRFERLGINYFRNDLDGWVQFVSNGETLSVFKENQPD